MRRYLIIGVLISIFLIAGVSFNEVIIKPFPFLDLDYVSANEWDSKPDGFYNLPSNLNTPATLFNEISKASNFESLDAKVRWATNLTRDFMRNSKGESIRDVMSVFDHSEKYKSICSESSKIFAALMTKVGVPSRVVWMHGHTVSEIYDGKKWVLIDTFGNVRAFNQIDEPLGIREILSDYDNSIFRKVVEDDNALPSQYLDSGYFASPNNVYRQQNLLLIVKGSELFNFHYKTKDIGAIIKATFNIKSNAVGEARQFVIDDYFVGNFGFRLVERYGE